MSTADRSIDPKLLASAREEFLQYGFHGASLKRICGNAGVTTGALYKRFQNKEDLYAHLVEGVIADLTYLNEQKASLLAHEIPDAVLVCCWDMNEASMMDWFDFLDQRRTAFTILMRCSEGTRFEKFEHEYANKMTELNYRFYQMAYERGIATEVITKKDLHVADSAYWKAICEPFIHDYSREELLILNKHICHFFNYYGLLGIAPELVAQYRDYDFNQFLRELMNYHEEEF